MAKLINGNGNKAIWSAQDADLIASICGNVTAIAAVGSQFNYTQEDANTIGVADGVIITKEGRRIQLDSGSVDLFTIPTGQLNVTSYYIIGYKLVQNSDTTQTCETFVQKMDNATDVITEDTFKGGSTEVYVSLYRVTQVGMNIDTVDLLLPSMKDLSELSNDLAIKTVTGTTLSAIATALNALSPEQIRESILQMDNRVFHNVSCDAANSKYVYALTDVALSDTSTAGITRQVYSNVGTVTYKMYDKSINGTLTTTDESFTSWILQYR